MRSGSIWPAVLLHFLTELLILPQKLLQPSMALILGATFLSDALLALLVWRKARAAASAQPPAANVRETPG